MKGISEAKLKCLNKLLEKAIKFDHDNYKVSISWNCSANNVWLSIFKFLVMDGEKFAKTVAAFDFYYGLTEDETVKRICDKIIKVLDELDEAENIEDIGTKLPFMGKPYVDINKFVGGEK